ncbi:MAG TPA: alpha-glycosidase, partial [Firmicutes bacterium]|nr:alpha-glycosidase [Bacillota bacterium]
TMNYRFTDLCRQFFAEHKIGVYEFDAQFQQLLMRYARPITNVQMNLLDSHDVPRFLSWCQGDLRRFKLAVLFQMTVPGVPSI